MQVSQKKKKKSTVNESHAEEQVSLMILYAVFKMII